MNAVDTNVLLRYLVEDDPAQARSATRFFTRECAVENSCFINRIVLCEAVWVLNRIYRFTRHQIAATLEHLLNTRELLIEDYNEVAGALADFREGVDFADALVARVNRKMGCDYTATFDRKASRRLGFRML